MKFFRNLIIIVLVGGTLLASIATFSRAGAASIQHPEGISLRDESVRQPGGFFFMYMNTPRYHTGGGLRMGK